MSAPATNLCIFRLFCSANGVGRPADSGVAFFNRAKTPLGHAHSQTALSRSLLPAKSARRGSRLRLPAVQTGSPAEAVSPNERAENAPRPKRPHLVRASRPDIIGKNGHAAEPGPPYTDRRPSARVGSPQSSRPRRRVAATQKKAPGAVADGGKFSRENSKIERDVDGPEIVIDESKPAG